MLGARIGWLHPAVEPNQIINSRGPKTPHAFAVARSLGGCPKTTSTEQAW
jgi:hypothetical protein